MTQKNNLPPFAEEQILPEEQLNLQNILAKFNQLVPTNFVQLESKERNYQCSTQGWKEPACERYIFFHHGQPIQLDIPHSLFNELEIEKEKNISYPVYLAPQVLEKNLDHFAYTIENKNEIFIQKPLNIENLEKELNKWLGEIKNSEVKLSHYKLSLLSSLFHSGKKSQDLTNLKLEMIRLRVDIITKEQELDNKGTQINQLTTEKDDLTNQVNVLSLRPTQEQLIEVQNQINQLNNQIANLNQQLVVANNTITTLQNTERVVNSNLARISQELKDEKRENQQKNQTINQLIIERDNYESELEKEQGWWDKWIANDIAFLKTESKLGCRGLEIQTLFFNFSNHFDQPFYSVGATRGGTLREVAKIKDREIKELIKNIYSMYVG